MLGYLLAILGLAALCCVWVVFQLWVKKHAPEIRPINLCCGACPDSECDRQRSE